eukprot:2400323-Amphidinium_carterae.1
MSLTLTHFYPQGFHRSFCQKWEWYHRPATLARRQGQRGSQQATKKRHRDALRCQKGTPCNPNWPISSEECWPHGQVWRESAREIWVRTAEDRKLGKDQHAHQRRATEGLHQPGAGHNSTAKKPER